MTIQVDVAELTARVHRAAVALEKTDTRIRQGRSYLLMMINRLDREKWSEDQRDTLIKDLRYVHFYLGEGHG